MIENSKTLTGKPLMEAIRELDRELEPHAYKAIEGGKARAIGLTDILPAYLHELVSEMFGALGVGWWFEIIDLKTRIIADDDSKKESFTSTCIIKVHYRYDDPDCAPITQVSMPIYGSGGSTNTQIEWAEKGAITSGLATAWSFAGYQISVYKGKRSHKTSGENAPAKPTSPPPKIPKDEVLVFYLENSRTENEFLLNCQLFCDVALKKQYTPIELCGNAKNAEKLKDMAKLEVDDVIEKCFHAVMTKRGTNEDMARAMWVQMMKDMSDAGIDFEAEDCVISDNDIPHIQKAWANNVTKG